MLLKMKPSDRYTAEQALNHAWIKERAPKAKDVALQSGFFDNLKGFRSHTKLVKPAMYSIPNLLSEDQIKNLKQIFMQMDGNQDGQLTAAEMRDGLAKAGLQDIPA